MLWEIRNNLFTQCLFSKLRIIWKLVFTVLIIRDVNNNNNKKRIVNQKCALLQNTKTLYFYYTLNNASNIDILWQNEYLILFGCYVEWCVAIFSSCMWGCTLIQQQQCNILVIIVTCNMQGCHSILENRLELAMCARGNVSSHN